MSTFSSSAFSTINLRKDGVPMNALMRRSAMVETCISVWPIPLGTTVQPSARAPDSIIEPAGVKW